MKIWIFQTDYNRYIMVPGKNEIDAWERVRWEVKKSEHNYDNLILIKSINGCLINEYFKI